MKFKEEQRFRAWWVLVFLLSLFGILTYAIVQQELFDHPFGSQPASTPILIITGFIPLVMILLYYISRFETIVDDDGILYKFYPFHLKYHRIRWKEIAHCYVRKYQAITEFGGWGIRLGNDGRAYNVAGDNGLQVELKNGGKVLFGTQKADELRQALEAAPIEIGNK